MLSKCLCKHEDGSSDPTQRGRRHCGQGGLLVVVATFARPTWENPRASKLTRRAALARSACHGETLPNRYLGKGLRNTPDTGLGPTHAHRHM